MTEMRAEERNLYPRLRRVSSPARWKFEGLRFFFFSSSCTLPEIGIRYWTLFLLYTRPLEVGSHRFGRLRKGLHAVERVSEVRGRDGF
jgi:hypothetical protein